MLAFSFTQLPAASLVSPIWQIVFAGVGLTTGVVVTFGVVVGVTTGVVVGVGVGVEVDTGVGVGVGVEDMPTPPALSGTQRPIFPPSRYVEPAGHT